jgi:cytochrome c553
MTASDLMRMMACGTGGHHASPSATVRIGAKVSFADAAAAKLAISVFAVAVPLAMIGSACAAGDVKQGRAKAFMCQACHGLDGLSKVPDAPNIAGQTEPYLIAQLQAFKSGARKNDAMSLVASALPDNEIENIAAYFSAIEISIVKIPIE